MGELQFCSNQNKCLTNTLNTTLAEIQKRLKSQASQINLQQNELQKLSMENDDQGDILVELKGAIKGIEDTMEHLPLGTIITWVNRPNKTSHHTVNIPEGWQR